MSLLSYNDLRGLVQQGVITNVTEDMINSSSIDLTLGDTILFEKSSTEFFPPYEVNIVEREPLNLLEYPLNVKPYKLRAGEFILAQTQQVFNLPNHISAEYKLKSSMARCGLEHLNAGWCDAGWNGSVLTLELKNMTRNHTLVLERGMRIGQIVFFSHLSVPEEKSYAKRGRYNGDKTVKGVKA